MSTTNTRKEKKTKKNYKQGLLRGFVFGNSRPVLDSKLIGSKFVYYEYEHAKKLGRFE